ncbi:MAG: hypothetical protein HC868_06575 [Sphingomonadales bacterium]|nr:hypothetical protein [Sphingomonadales bacterium]
MKEPIKVSAKVSAGGQPTEEDIAALKALGVRKIINLRRHGEQNQPLDPAAQGDVVMRAGLEYVHIPVDPKNLHPSSAEAVAKAIDACDGQVYVHCAAGAAPSRTHCLLMPKRKAARRTRSSRRPRRSAPRSPTKASRRMCARSRGMGSRGG